MDKVVQLFRPVYDSNSKILILGTFPSVKSREAKFYYQHPRNRFWNVISEIVQKKEYETIEDMRKMLIDNNIALWDVIESCEITGSSDSSIKNIVPADLSIILDNANIKKIYANGDKAFKIYMKYAYPITKREIIKLPSTSPVNATFFGKISRQLDTDKKLFVVILLIMYLFIKNMNKMQDISFYICILMLNYNMKSKENTIYHQKVYLK